MTPKQKKTVTAVGAVFAASISIVVWIFVSPFNPETELGLEQEKTATFVRGAIESHGLTHLFKTTQILSRAQLPQPGIPVPLPGVIQRTISEGWTEDTSL